MCLWRFCGNYSVPVTFQKMESLSSVFLPPPPGCPRIVYKLMMQCWSVLVTNVWWFPSFSVCVHAYDLLNFITRTSCRNADSLAKPTWFTINQSLQDAELTLQTEAQEGDDFIPREGFLLGSPLESAINLYMDLQREYQQSVLLHPHHKVL